MEITLPVSHVSMHLPINIDSITETYKGLISLPYTYTVTCKLNHTHTDTIQCAHACTFIHISQLQSSRNRMDIVMASLRLCHADCAFKSCPFPIDFHWHTTLPSLWARNGGLGKHIGLPLPASLALLLLVSRGWNGSLCFVYRVDPMFSLKA